MNESSDTAEKEIQHPDHGEIKEIILNDRIHDHEKKLFCERCHHFADKLEDFDDIDCDHYKKTHENITEGL